MAAPNRSDRKWRARAALMRALPMECLKELQDLKKQLRLAESNDQEYDLIEQWAHAHRMSAEWFVVRLHSVLGNGLDINDPQVWNAQLWNDSDNDEFLLRWSALETSWRVQTELDELNATIRAVPRTRGHSRANNDAVAAAYRQHHTKWSARRSLHEIAAAPPFEPWKVFLGRARKHYQARAKAAREAGFSRFKQNEDDIRARRFLQHRVSHRKPASMATFQTKERISNDLSEFARLVDMPALKDSLTRKHPPKLRD